MAFFYPNIPLLSTIPNLHHSFSVHLMNCYFPDFWYSHVTEKRTSEGRNAICEKSRISCGSKVHSFWNALKNTGPKILIKTETPRITEQVSNIEGVVILMHREYKAPFDVSSHIRNLHEGWKASPENLAKAAAYGIELLPGKLWLRVTQKAKSHKMRLQLEQPHTTNPFIIGYSSIQSKIKSFSLFL